MKKKKFKAILVTSVILLALTGCSELLSKPVETTLQYPDETIHMIVSEEEISSITVLYPNLRSADFSGSTCYSALERFIESNPQISVNYTVDVGGKAFASDTAEMTLYPGDYEFGQLIQALSYLHEVRSVFFENSSLMPETIDLLRGQFPKIQFEYSVTFCGQTFDSQQRTIDLSGCDPDAVIYHAPELVLLPQLQTINLMDAENNSAFTLKQAVSLQETVPDLMLNYEFELFDQRVSTSAEEIVYANKYIGNKAGNLEILCDALKLLKGCSRFVLDNCHFENDTLAQLRNEYRGRTKIVWRIFYGEGSILTDRTMIRHVYGLYDSNCKNLIYCEDAEYVDFGHNEYLKTCEFVKGMPHLKAIILSGSMVSDLSPLAQCKELEFLELTYCGYVQDLAPLAKCSSLQCLNIAYTKAADLSALDDLALQILVDARSGVNEDEDARFNAMHPDCLVQHTGDAKDDYPYGYPWRFDESGESNSYYALLQEKFHYPNTANTIY